MKIISKLVTDAVAHLTTKDKELLAGKIGITRKTLDNVKAGKSTLNLEQLAILEDELQIELINKWLVAAGRGKMASVNEEAAIYKAGKDPEFTIGLKLIVKEKSTEEFTGFLQDLRLLCDKYGYSLA